MMFPQKWYQNVQNLVSGFIAKFWLDVEVIFMVYNSAKYTMEKVFFCNNIESFKCFNVFLVKFLGKPCARDR